MVSSNILSKVIIEMRIIVACLLALTASVRLHEMHLSAGEKSGVDPIAANASAQDGAQESPQGSADYLAARAVADAVAKALSGNGIDVAFPLMTQKGKDDFCSRSVRFAMLFEQDESVIYDLLFGYSDEFQSIFKQPDASKQVALDKIKSLVSQYGLKELDIAGTIAEVVLTPEEMGDSDMSASMKTWVTKKQQVLSAATNKLIGPDHQLKAATEFTVALNDCLGFPVVFNVAMVLVNDKQATARVFPKIDRLQLEKLSLTEAARSELEQRLRRFDREMSCWLVLSKTDDGWKFDGFDDVTKIGRLRGEFDAQPELLIKTFKLSGTNVDGRNIDFQDYAGKVVLVDFWGTWCNSRIESLPAMMSVYNKFKGQGFEIIGVAGDSDANLKEFLQQQPLPWTNITDGSAVWFRRYNIMAHPVTLLFDKTGRHVATNLDAENLEKAVEILLAGGDIDEIYPDAIRILEKGMELARKENKVVFLHFGADWCGPCKIMERWMAKPSVKALLEKAMVDIKIDVDQHHYAGSVLYRYSDGTAGIPWYAILNTNDGSAIATCMSEKLGSNIGIPFSDDGIEHFMGMLKACGKFSDEDLEAIVLSLREEQKSLGF